MVSAARDMRQEILEIHTQEGHFQGLRIGWTTPPDSRCWAALRPPSCVASPSRWPAACGVLADLPGTAEERHLSMAPKVFGGDGVTDTLRRHVTNASWVVEWSRPFHDEAAFGQLAEEAEKKTARAVDAPRGRNSASTWCRPCARPGLGRLLVSHVFDMARTFALQKLVVQMTHGSAWSTGGVSQAVVRPGSAVGGFRGGPERRVPGPGHDDVRRRGVDRPGGRAGTALRLVDCLEDQVRPGVARSAHELQAFGTCGIRERAIQGGYRRVVAHRKAEVSGVAGGEAVPPRQRHHLAPA